MQRNFMRKLLFLPLFLVSCQTAAVSKTVLLFKTMRQISHQKIGSSLPFLAYKSALQARAFSIEEQRFAMLQEERSVAYNQKKLYAELVELQKNKSKQEFTQLLEDRLKKAEEKYQKALNRPTLVL